MKRQNYLPTNSGSVRSRVPRAPLPFNLPSLRREAGANLATGGIAATGAKWATPRCTDSDDARHHAKHEDPPPAPKTAWGGAGLRSTRPTSDFPNLAKSSQSSATNVSALSNTDADQSLTKSIVKKNENDSSDLRQESLTDPSISSDPNLVEDRSSSLSPSASALAQHQCTEAKSAAAASVSDGGDDDDGDNDDDDEDEGDNDNDDGDDDDDDDDDWADDSHMIDFLSDPVPLAEISFPDDGKGESSPSSSQPSILTPTPRPSRTMFPSPPRQDPSSLSQQQFPPPAAHWSVPTHLPASQNRPASPYQPVVTRPSAMFPDRLVASKPTFNQNFSDAELKAIEDQAALMKSKAEQAKESRRREEEERERIQKERSARKLRELEERLRLKKEQEAGMSFSSGSSLLAPATHRAVPTNELFESDPRIENPQKGRHDESLPQRVLLRRAKGDILSRDFSSTHRHSELSRPSHGQTHRRYRQGPTGGGFDGRQSSGGGFDPRHRFNRPYDGPADNETREQWLERRRKETESRDAVRSIIDIIITRAVNGGHAAPKRSYQRRGPPGHAPSSRRDYLKKDNRGLQAESRAPASRESHSDRSRPSSFRREGSSKFDGLSRREVPPRREGPYRREGPGRFDESSRHDDVSRRDEFHKGGQTNRSDETSRTDERPRRGEPYRQNEPLKRGEALRQDESHRRDEPLRRDEPPQQDELFRQGEPLRRGEPHKLDSPSRRDGLSRRDVVPKSDGPPRLDGTTRLVGRPKRDGSVERDESAERDVSAKRDGSPSDRLLAHISNRRGFPAAPDSLERAPSGAETRLRGATTDITQCSLNNEKPQKQSEHPDIKSNLNTALDVTPKSDSALGNNSVIDFTAKNSNEHSGESNVQVSSLSENAKCATEMKDKEAFETKSSSMVTSRKRMAPPPVRPAPWANKTQIPPAHLMGMSPMALLRAQEKAAATERLSGVRKDAPISESSSVTKVVESSPEHCARREKQAEHTPLSTRSVQLGSDKPIASKHGNIAEGEGSLSPNENDVSSVRSAKHSSHSVPQTVHEKMKSLTIPSALGGNVKVLMNPNTRREVGDMQGNGGRNSGFGGRPGRGKTTNPESNRGRGAFHRRRGGKIDYSNRESKDFKKNDGMFSSDNQSSTDITAELRDRDTFSTSLASIPIVLDEKEESRAWANASSGPAPTPSFDAIKRAFSNQPAPFALVGAPLIPSVPLVSEIKTSTDAESSDPFENKNNTWGPTNKSWSEAISEEKDMSAWWKSGIESEKLRGDEQVDVQIQAGRSPADLKASKELTHSPRSKRDMNMDHHYLHQSSISGGTDREHGQVRGRRNIRSGRRNRRGRPGRPDISGAGSISAAVGHRAVENPGYRRFEHEHMGLNRGSNKSLENKSSPHARGHPLSVPIVATSDINQKDPTESEQSEHFTTNGEMSVSLTVAENDGGTSTLREERGIGRSVSRGRGRRGLGKTRRGNGGRDSPGGSIRTNPSRRQSDLTLNSSEVSVGRGHLQISTEGSATYRNDDLKRESSRRARNPRDGRSELNATTVTSPNQSYSSGEFNQPRSGIKLSTKQGVTTVRTSNADQERSTSKDMSRDNGEPSIWNDEMIHNLRLSTAPKGPETDDEVTSVMSLKGQNRGRSRGGRRRGGRHIGRGSRGRGRGGVALGNAND